MTSTWMKRTIDDICVFRGGGTPSKSKESYWKGDIPWVSPKDMKSDVITDSIDHISAAAITESTTNLIPAGSILVVVRSGILARTIPVAITGRDVTINQDIKALCPDSTVDAWFLFYFLKSRLEEMLGLASRGATVHRIMADQIRLMEIPVPPLAEQQRIVGILDEAFEGIATAKANAEKNLQNARALFESHLQSVFTQRGEGWVETKLDDVTDLITCGVAKRPEYVPEGIPFLSAKNVKSGQVIWSGHQYVSEESHRALTKHNKPKIGDILYTRVGSYGEAAIIDRDIEFSIFVSLTLIKPKPVVLNSFLKHYLNSSAVKELAADSITGSGVGNLNVGTVREFPIHLPPVSEQRSIVSQLDELHEETQRLATIYERKLAAMDNLKKSLLHQAFSGEL
jgi:type I restriction enzyme S subunit